MIQRWIQNFLAFFQKKQEPFFEITESLEEKIKKEIVEKTGITPTESQWEMILTGSSHAYVVAGAGSGKSTSLILRVVVLFHYLGCPLDQITVFSFTRATVDEFKGKLVNILNKYGYDYSKKDVDSTVRTFHSKIFEFKTGSFSHTEFFDFEEDYWGKVGFSLNAKQKNIMFETHRSLYKQSSAYKKIIDNMFFRHELYLQKYDNYRKRIERLLVKEDVDTEICELVRQIDESPFKDHELIKISAGSHFPESSFLINAILDGNYVLYIPEREVLEKALGKKQGRKSWSHLNKKLDALLMLSSKHYIVVTSENDWKRIQGHKYDNSEVPAFPVKLDGEFDYTPLIEMYYEAADFIRSLGLDVYKTLNHSSFFDLKDADKDFCSALALYWPFFFEQMTDGNRVLVSELFLAYSDKNIESFKRGGASIKDVLSSMRHILIDEFQDISPEIANWIKGVLKAQQIINGAKSSLMCIGDDWQSIYGWRGSTPGYFIDFEKHFPSKNNVKITMEENFRSYQGIISNAESILESIDYKMPKKGRSFRSGKAQIHFFGSDKAYSDNNEIKHIIDSSEDIFILYRGAGQKNIADRFRRQYKIKPKVLKTYHGSKGLEADTIILFGDCRAFGNYPFRNGVYKAAQFKQTYEEAQRDEALRLAYVGMTRARKHLIWFSDTNSGGAYIKARNFWERNSLRN